MSADFWAVIGTAVAVLVAITAQGHDLRQLMEPLKGRIDAVNLRLDDVNGRFSRFEGRFDEMNRWSKPNFRSVPGKLSTNAGVQAFLSVYNAFTSRPKSSNARACKGLG